jgi:thiopeptide-type bacteriocin biosynthesis protein
MKGDKALRLQLDQKLRGAQRELAPLLAGGAATDALAPALAPFERRTRDLAPLAAAMARLEAEGRLTAPVREMAPSFVHMHVNRLIRSAARAHEMVLYDFLHQLFTSREARQKTLTP